MRRHRPPFERCAEMSEIPVIENADADGMADTVTAADPDNAAAKPPSPVCDITAADCMQPADEVPDTAGGATGDF